MGRVIQPERQAAAWYTPDASDFRFGASKQPNAPWIGQGIGGRHDPVLSTAATQAFMMQASPMNYDAENSTQPLAGQYRRRV